jgi:hypothetical protein
MLAAGKRTPAMLAAGVGKLLGTQTGTYWPKIHVRDAFFEVVALIKNRVTVHTGKLLGASRKPTTEQVEDKETSGG